jgi:hypothetical protein
VKESSTSETGPTTASRTIASAAVLSPAAPLNRCPRTEPLASGERRLSCRSSVVVISPSLRRDAMNGSTAPHGCASTARDDRAAAAIDRRHPGALLMRLPLAGWLEKVDQGEQVSQLVGKAGPLSATTTPLLIAPIPRLRPKLALRIRMDPAPVLPALLAATRGSRRTSASSPKRSCRSEPTGNESGRAGRPRGTLETGAARGERPRYRRT